MSFADLYKRAQAKKPKISTGWVRDQVIDLTPISTVYELWTGLIDPTDMRGFWIEGPLGAPRPLAENEALIVLARDLPKPWRRIVYTKELMHAFDEDDEKADSPDKLDKQVNKFSDPTADGSPQFRAEAKAFWRALAVLCPEEYRAEQKKAIEAGSATAAMMAVRLAIPERYIDDILRENFLEIVDAVKK